MSTQLFELGFTKGKLGWYTQGSTMIHVDGNYLSGYKSGRLIGHGKVTRVKTFLEKLELLEN